MTDLAGRTLGRYRLETLLGRGGMADVWRATDTKLARTVAVKVIHTSFAQDPHFAERFLREARVVASLEHPNILPVYDFGEEGGIPFLVMPHLAGGTLRERLRGVPAPLLVGAMWIRQLAEALDAAHAAGVLHRDVKPANVLLGKDDRLFLADFGIAKMVETLTGLTATGVVVGTPVYMAPEQAQGHSATPATDRYALAVVAYEILSGRPPFDGENPLSLMHQHVSTPAPALSSKVGGLPAGLDAVLAQALSKDPAQRPPTCRAIADAVASFLPTGVLPAVSSGTWTSGTAPTVLQPRGPTPPPGVPPTTPWSPEAPAAAPAPVITPPPASLTSDATILTAGRRRRRGLMLGAAATAVLLLAVAVEEKGRRDRAASAVPTPMQAAAPPVPTAAAAVPVTVVELPQTPTPDLRIEDLEKRVKNAEASAREAKTAAAKAAAAPAVTPAAPAVPPPPAPAVVAAIPEENAPGHAPLMAARERLDVTKKSDHRLSKDDFQFALDAARRVIAEHPKSPDAHYLATYAQGGLAYTAGQDAVASGLVVEAVLALQRAGKQDHRALQQLLSRPDGTVVAPKGWELAVAYGDARGEALPLLDAAVRDDPRDARARRARAALRKLHGLEPDGPEPRHPFGLKR